MSALMMGFYEIRDRGLFDMVPEVESLESGQKMLLSRIPLPVVANTLEYQGSLVCDDRPDVGTKKNFNNDAATMVMILKGYNRSEAQCFLYRHFRKEAEALFKKEKETGKLLERQLTAMGGAFPDGDDTGLVDGRTKFRLYRRGVMGASKSRNPVPAVSTKLIGVTGHSEYLFTLDEILVRTHSLMSYNMSGQSICIQPISDRYEFITINDIRTEDMECMAQDGLVPNLVLSTSWNHFQVTFVIPKHLPTPVMESFSANLASRYGGVRNEEVNDGALLLFAAGTENHDEAVARNGVRPEVTLESCSMSMSDGFRDALLEELRSPLGFFASMKQYQRSLGRSTMALHRDRDFAESLYMYQDVAGHEHEDMYLSEDEIVAVLEGNAETQKIRSGNIGYINFNILEKIQAGNPKTVLPIIEAPLFSPSPVPYLTGKDTSHENGPSAPSRDIGEAQERGTDEVTELSGGESWAKEDMPPSENKKPEGSLLFRKIRGLFQ